MLAFMLLRTASAVSPVQMSRGAQNHLIMPAMVNGHAASFLIDTGADVSFLQANRAADFGVKASPEQVRSGDQSFQGGAVAELRAGDVTLGSSTFALYNPAQFRGSVPGKDGKTADGILGLDILRRYKAVINCRTRQIFFQTNGEPQLDLVATTRALGFAALPMSESRRGFLTVPCNIGRSAGALVLDTGAFVTTLNDAVSRALDLQRTPSRLTTRSLDGRVRAVELAQVDSLRIGSVLIAPQKFAVSDIFGARKSLRTFTGINRLEYYDAAALRNRKELFGLLGNELLDQRRAIIDLDRMTLFLK